MQILIKDTFIVDNKTTNNPKKQSILIEDGIITEISGKIDVKADKVIEASGMYTSPGWLDIGTQTGEPGYEHREDIQSVTNAAAAGGYTAIAPFPNTMPVIQTKADISFLKERSGNNVTLIYPIGALSLNCEGKEMTELYDMFSAGAVAFSDGPKSIQNSGLMKRSLEYVQAFKGLILHQASDSSLTDGGQIHEGEMSTSLGMKGIPSLAEELLIERDIRLLEYTGGKIHFANISTARSVDLIKKAKKEGLQVTASVAIMNLCYDDNYLSEFDSNFKVLPPLRSKSDKRALLKGLKDGTIDCITSNHVPLEADVKELEFPYAKFGAIQLETCLSSIICFTDLEATPSFLVEKLCIKPREILEIGIPKIEKGERAEITIFDLEKEWTYEEKSILSKSRNSSLIGKKLKAKVKATIRNNKLYLDR